MRKTLFTIAVAAMVIAGCAKPSETTKNDAAKKYFDSWMQINHPEAYETPLGSYIFSMQQGLGKPAGKASENPYVRVNYTMRKLDGTISATTYPKIAQQVGTYKETNFYGPDVFNRTPGSIAVGFDELLEQMNEGAKVTAAVPGWLNGTKVYSNKEDYLKNVTGNDYIYDIELVEVIKDIKTWEVDSLIRYMKEAYPQINPTDTVSGTEYNGKKYGFYFIKQQETDKPDSTYATDTKVYLNYTGKLLNGQVFDTTIEKVAKDAGIYKQGQKYEPAFVTWAAEYKDLKFGTSSSDLIDGFKFALFQMKPHEKGVALFYSGLGYKETGSGNSIPGYSPLIFEFELVDKK